MKGGTSAGDGRSQGVFSALHRLSTFQDSRAGRDPSVIQGEPPKAVKRKIPFGRLGSLARNHLSGRAPHLNSNPMRIAPLFLLLIVTAACGGSAGTSPTLRAEQLDDRIRITRGDELVTEYRYSPDQKYPYFYPVVGPRSGESVTTESSEPYPHHHSLFFGLDHVNGGNYWQDGLERGQILAEETEILQSNGAEVVFRQNNIWSRPDAESPFRDERIIRVRAPGEELRVIDFDVTLTPLIDVRVRKTNHSLFAARMVPELSVDNGGTLVNAHGDRNAEGTFGVAAEWAAFYGERGGVVEGLAILEHPDNRWAPSSWFTRDYGFFSPTPFEWLEGGLKLAQGESVRLRYRVVVHGGTPEEAGIARMYAEYVGGS